MGLVRKTFTANGNLTVPAGITQAFIMAIGGGGGGCGGEGGRYNTGVAYNAQGGGGGAAGNLVEGWFGVTPGETLTVVVGAGGAVTAGSTTGGNDVDTTPTVGNDGSSSTVTGGTSGLLVTALGGGAGRMAGVPDASAAGTATSQGGSPFFTPGFTQIGRWVSNSGQAGFGGRSGTAGGSFTSSPTHGAPGVGTTRPVALSGGVSSGSRNAGAAGGAGAPGPLENAYNPINGMGGAGATAAAAGTAGSPGTTGPGYGAGGGGGGGGQGATNAQTTGNGGQGAAGAAGYVEIGWYE